MKWTYWFVVFILCLIVMQVGYAKDKKTVEYDSALVQIEQQISELGAQLYNSRRDDVKSNAISEEILALFERAFENPLAFDYPFDSVFPVGKIESEKGELQIFTWNIILNNGESTHFGFLSYQNKGLQKTYVLKDKTGTIENELTSTLTADEWLGANYYNIVEAKNQSGTHYVLLGWKGNNLHSNKKIIETLYFTESGKPKFGRSLIKLERKKLKRVVFEYSYMVDMFLKYDPDYDLIVFDHLSPDSGVEAGDRQFYGPDLSYDALKYNGDYWEYLPAIDYKMQSGKKRKKR